MQYKRILLKISGESLMGEGTYGISPDMIAFVAREIRLVHEAGVQIGLVIGAGNIFRGVSGAAGGMNRAAADNMGMLATVLNALAMEDGLERAGCRSFAVLSADYFVQGMNDRAFGDVRNVYVNIAWSFPTLTISQLNALMGFMDNGGNLLISGQDIGWDFMSGSAGSHNSPEAADFYTNYLKAGYISDGTSADYIIYANSHDNVYDQVPDAFLIDIYDGNMYPDNVMATQGADEVFYYQSNNHAAVVKSVSDIYKTIYFACGLEMIGQPIITNEIMKLTYQWFNGLLSEEEYDEVVMGLFAGESSPNPAHEYSHIPVHLDEDGTLVLFNSAGQIIRHVSITKNNRELILDVSGLEPGVYFYRVTSGNRMTQTRKLVVY